MDNVKTLTATTVSTTTLVSASSPTTVFSNTESVDDFVETTLPWALNRTRKINFPPLFCLHFLYLYVHFWFVLLSYIYVRKNTLSLKMRNSLWMIQLNSQANKSLLMIDWTSCSWPYYWSSQIQIFFRTWRSKWKLRVPVLFSSLWQNLASFQRCRFQSKLECYKPVSYTHLTLPTTPYV